MDTASPPPTLDRDLGTASEGPGLPARWSPRKVAWFLATFGLAWFLLDRLATAPPRAGRALVTVVVCGAVLVVSERVAAPAPLGTVLRRLGFGRPPLRAMVAAGLVGGAVLATYVGGAAVLGVHLELRPAWPTVLVGALLFHGVAEEMVWRGFAYGHLRRGRTMGSAIGWTIPLIALTHVPAVAELGPGVGLLAVLTAGVTCFPFAHLYDRGGRTIWAPATLHGLVGTWQLFERTYPVTFSVLVLLGTIVVPLGALLFGDRWFGPRRGSGPARTDPSPLPPPAPPASTNPHRRTP